MEKIPEQPDLEENYSNLDESSIDDILQDLEQTLKEMEEAEEAQLKSMDEVEEKNLRECALKSMSTIGEKPEDLIEFKLNDVERQSVEESQSIQLFPVASEKTQNVTKFPGFSTKEDTGHPQHIYNQNFAKNRTDINNNAGVYIETPSKAETVYNKVVSMYPISFPSTNANIKQIGSMNPICLSTRNNINQNTEIVKATVPETHRNDREFSMSSISENDISETEINRCHLKHLKTIPEHTTSSYCRTVVEYYEKLHFRSTNNSENTLAKLRRSRSRQRRSSSSDYKRYRRRSSSKYKRSRRSRSRESFKIRYPRSPRKRSPSSEYRSASYRYNIKKTIRHKSRSRSRESLRYSRRSSSFESRRRYHRSPSTRHDNPRRYCNKRSSSRESRTSKKLRVDKYKRDRESSEEIPQKKRKQEIDLRRVLNYYKSKRASKESETIKPEESKKTLSLFENYWNKDVLERIGMPGTRVNKETMTDEVVISEKKGPPVDKECQTDANMITDFGTQTLPCIIHQAVEEIIEILSDDDNGEPAQETGGDQVAPIPVAIAKEGTVILKITFETILVEAKSYYPNHQKFLEHLEEIRSISPFFKASYFNNYLYIWTTKYFGEWIMEFLATFKYQPNKIISIVFSDNPPESSEYKEIKDKTAKKLLNSGMSKVRLIFMKLTGYQQKLNENNYKSVIQKIRKLTAVNDNFKNILQESNIMYSNNTIKIISNTSMEYTKRLKELVNTFNFNNFKGLKLSIFDYYVKLKVIGVKYETTIEQLDKVLQMCLQKTCLQVANWFVAEYKSPSIFVYVPRKDADFIKTNPKFVVKGKFIIIFDFVDRN
ncbi:hypothetical protein ACFFRR_010016 [Megaselia abdita]